MSTYERYDSQQAATYACNRRAVGLDQIVRALREGIRPLEDIHLLDAGCGTGLYAIAIGPRVARLTGMDVSPAMLQVAVRRTVEAGLRGRLSFCRGSLLALPFAPGSFDAVMINQVLHHLEDGRDRRYRAHGRALVHASEALRPGGLLMINACTHEQICSGFWYYDLIPKAREQSLRRGASAEQIATFVREAGLEFVDRRVASDEVMQGPRYFEPMGPTDPEWRRLDSIWALATPEEVCYAVEVVERLQEEGRLAAWVEERDERRRRVGQFTFFIARKPAFARPWAR